MAAIHGKIAKVKLGANVVGRITEWSLDVSRDTSDVTEQGGANLPWRDFIAGLVGAEGSLSGFLDLTDTNGQLAIWTSLTSDTPLDMDFFVDATHAFSASILVTKFGAKSPVDGEETVDLSVKVTGAVEYGTPS